MQQQNTTTQDAADPSDVLRAAITAKVNADAALIAAMNAAHAAGVSANEIARQMFGIMSRPTVLAVLQTGKALRGVGASSRAAGAKMQRLAAHLSDA